MMTDKHELFISEENGELRHIRDGKLAKLLERKEAMTSEPFQVTDSNFDEVVKTHALALIDFTASWCGPCRAMTPTVHELAEKYAGRVLIGKLDVDENPQTAERFQVMTVPTLLMVKDGKEVDRIVGLVPKQYIEAALEKQMGK